MQQHQNGQPCSITVENTRGILKVRRVCLGVEVRFKLLVERGKQKGMHKYHEEEHAKQWEHQK